MTKPLDPEIKALKALVRALKDVDPNIRARILRWAIQRWQP